MPSRIVSAEYLQYRDRARNSDKIYNIFLVEETDGNFCCVSEYGRREAWPVTVLLCSNKSGPIAEQVFRKKVEAKRQHPTTPYWTSTDGPSQSPFAKAHASQPDGVSDIPNTKAVSSSAKQAVGNKPKTNRILNQAQIDSLEI